MTPELAYYDFGHHVTAFSTTRHGGCSTGSHACLNVNAYCGDNPQTVEQNRRLLCQELGLTDTGCLMIPHQVHDDGVMTIDHTFLAQPTTLQREQLEGIDALITDQCGICIGVSTADCIPILIYDPHHHCAAAIHAGWRGTVKRIAQKAARQMAAVYHSNYAQMRVVIGPGISLRNFEVGQEVYDQFLAAAFPMQQIADTVSWPKPHIDLPFCNRLQLQDMGIPADHIHDCAVCTYDHTDRFFSARRLGTTSGRIYTGIVL